MNISQRVRSVLIAALTVGLLAVPATSGAAVRISSAGPQMDYVPGEVVVRTSPGPAKVVQVPDGQTVLSYAARLRARGGVLSATPNWIARVSGYIPNDPGTSGQAGGWRDIQWNFMPEHGVDAPTAWENLIAAGRPGGAGVTVAVLDTGVAYANRGRFRRSPDFAATKFRKGYDFVDMDQYPADQNGHGTHVTGTIAEGINNGVALTGLAYGARIMPVRVLDRLGEGDSVAIARGIRFAAKNGAKIINLSFEFSSTVTADQIPDILDALRYARRRGVLVVGAAGNASASAVAYPAKSTHVLSVGATTEHGCQAEYSNTGTGLDISAPGGGQDATIDDPNCAAEGRVGRDIIQMTFLRSVKSFGLPGGFMGTSMAAPHVSAIAALVVASGVIGPNPTPDQIESRLKSTATDLGKPGPDPRYGAGMVNAGRATAPPAPPAPPPAEQPQPQQ
jgi:serine protease